MRISEHRYTKDLNRYNLAFRLVHHEARTRTIARWTGLSPYRIRRLFRAYASDGKGRGATRHRGNSPHSLEFFWRTSQMRWEAGVFGWMCRVAGILPLRAPGSFDPLFDLSCGHQLCQILEDYRAYLHREYHCHSRLTFEHAFLLLKALSREQEAALGRCPRCAGAILVDPLEVRARRCVFCSGVARR